MGRIGQAKLLALAFRTLEDVLAQAEHGPVPPNWGCRVALAVLANAGIGERWQFDEFWRGMQDHHVGAYHDDQARYLRSGCLLGMLRSWYQSAGIPQPTESQRAAWARRHHPDLVDSDTGAPQPAIMCNRYTPGDRELVERLFEATRLRDFNAGPETVHPKDPAIVVRIENGKRVVDQMTWGFPVQLRSKKTGNLLKPKPVNNARFDKLGGYWKRWAVNPANRCLIPTARFAEAVGKRGAMTETWLSVKDQPVFAWAGLWRSSDEWGNCFTGVMTDAAPELVHIHDRSPVILEPGQWDEWLSCPFEEMVRFDHALPADRMKIEPSDQLWKRG